MITLNLVVESELVIMGRRGEANESRDVQRFCKEYSVRLVREGTTTERGFREPMYFFSDELGGYTIDAIRSSLG